MLSKAPVAPYQSTACGHMILFFAWHTAQSLIKRGRRAADKNGL
jgi:hypothetical protein